MSNEEMTLDDLLEGVDGTAADETEEEETEDVTEPEEEEEDDAPAPAPTSPAIDQKTLELAIRMVQAQQTQQKPEPEDEDYLYDPKALREQMRKEYQQELQSMRAEIDTIKRPAKIAEIAQQAGLSDPSVIAGLASDFSTADLEFLAKSPAFVALVKKAGGAPAKQARVKTPLPANTPKGPKPAKVEVSSGDRELLEHYAKKYGKDSPQYKERASNLLKGSK
jgi:AraC-like DNA-binding protein